MSAAPAEWLSYEEARATILEHCTRLGTTRCHIDEALGLAAAEPVTSRVDHPPWDNSAMDGYAVRAADVSDARPESPVTLPVVDDVPAGSFPTGPLREATVVRVMTGAPVPDGATGVIRVEHTEPGSSGEVRIRESSDSQRNIRRRGEDVRAGATVLVAGEEITPSVIGTLALTGNPEVVVARRPVVAVLATGDELADLDDLDLALEGKKIVNSNSHALAAQLRRAGATPVLLGIARDDPESIASHLQAGLEHDALISTAGVSVGERDQVKEALEAMGMRRVFWRAKVRPGSPLAFGVLDGKPIWGLPGNPVSAMVTFEVLVRPAVRKMAGHRHDRRRLLARMGTEIASTPALTHFLRVRLEWQPEGPPSAVLTGPQGSGILTSMKEADALLVVPEGVDRLDAGQLAEVIPLD